MNTEEFKAKLCNCENHLEDVAKSIEEAREQLAELVEKPKLPKLRHGDFGCFRDGTPRICIIDSIYDEERRCGKSCDIEYYTILGNIFDLLKEWSEDSDRANIDGFVLEICGNRIVIGGRRFLIDQATEFWHKLGQMIATLKRKENKCQKT